MTTDNTTSQLIINKLTKAQYEAIANPSNTELYLTPDTTEQDIADAITAHNGSSSAHSSLFNAKVTANNAITGATKCKITYDSKGLVTGGANLSASDIPNLTLSKITDVTATASELNVLDGITATTTELNYCDGVTSNIQTQLNNKLSEVPQATSSSLGGIKASAKTSAETQEVKIDTSTGKLYVQPGGVSSVAFADITGQPTDNTNLATALSGKQPTLVSGTNIKTINNESILGSGNVTTAKITLREW